MYNVLLVDDEYYHREALKSTICWEEYGCCICGEANNGVLGIERAKELKPDIVLADVSMPFLNGLQMIEEIKQFLPNAVFAIVTGYSEFEYAKRGMELGVKYLIVKPVSHKELIDSLGQMVKELDTKKEASQEYNSLRFWAGKNARNNKRKFLEMLLDGNGDITRERFLYECGNLQLPLQNGGYVVCCLRVNNCAPIRLEAQEWEEKIQRMLEEEVKTSTVNELMDDLIISR